MWLGIREERLEEGLIRMRRGGALRWATKLEKKDPKKKEESWDKSAWQFEAPQVNPHSWHLRQLPENGLQVRDCWASAAAEPRERTLEVGVWVVPRWQSHPLIWQY